MRNAFSFLQSASLFKNSLWYELLKPTSYAKPAITCAAVLLQRLQTPSAAERSTSPPKKI